MKISATIILTLCFLLHATNANSQKPIAPETANSIEAIRSAIAPSLGYGCPQSVHFDQWGRQVFALWYCPFSGRAACYLHAYYYDPKAKKWIRFLDEFLEGTHDLSLEISGRHDSLVVKDVTQKEILKRDLSKLPYRKWDQQEKDAEQGR